MWLLRGRRCVMGGRSLGVMLRGRRCVMGGRSLGVMLRGRRYESPGAMTGDGKTLLVIVMVMVFKIQ